MKPLTFLSPDDQVLLWLLEIARRADLLALRHGPGRLSDRRIWLLAEFAVFEETERARPLALALAAG